MAAKKKQQSQASDLVPAIEAAPLPPKDVRRVTYGLLLKCTSPLAHASETFGNTQVIQREDIRHGDDIVAVPRITADTLRHALREAFALYYLDTLCLRGSQSLTENAVRLLFNGGIITGKQDGAFKPDDYRRVCELFPIFGLLGGCVSNRSFGGRLRADTALLYCEETLDAMPPWVIGWEQLPAPLPATSHVTEQVRVRFDHERRADNQVLLKGGQASEGSPMPRSYEEVMRGSLFLWQLTAIVHDDLELDTLNVTVAKALELMAVAGIGGKRASGHGTLEFVQGTWSRVDHGSVLTPHLLERSDAIKTWLSEVVA